MNNNNNQVNIPKDPQSILHILQAGNKRFMENIRQNRDHHSGIDATKDGQKPFAAILSCMDSRVAAELVFDQGIGDIFNIRIAGNIITPEVLGSLEYAVEVSGVPVILILGHTGCGAIGGACDQVSLGNLTGLLEKIQPAIRAEKTVTDNRNSQNPEFVRKVTLLHLENVLSDMLEQSSVIANAVRSDKLLVATAIYDVASGAVQFLSGTTDLEVLALIPQGASV
ncbi:carbonic anhydrase [Arachidicoccus terrestris]|uniref:carbonic anhydrase n=1 Tax=Arachidicoccus terrestris TaxID=2875539 RepID=UPI001CC685DF|nr:carbonic anhydrase [Arachidicoccus terrestris]UAY56306.1 carbonic anhydrase [Arachidicoccus terrestris]